MAMHTGADPPSTQPFPSRSSTAWSQPFSAKARRRDVSVARLVFDLLDTIAADGLVGAVLDDGHPSSPEPRGPGRPRPTDPSK